MSQSKDVFSGLPTIPCKKCKSLPITGLRCVRCGSLSHPSCVKLLKNVKIISETQIVCCDSDDGMSKNENNYLTPQPVDASSINNSDNDNILMLINVAMQPLLQKIEMLRKEVYDLKENNKDLVRLLTNNGNVPSFASKFPSKPISAHTNKCKYEDLNKPDPSLKKQIPVIRNVDKASKRNEDNECIQKSADDTKQTEQTLGSSDEDGHFLDTEKENPWVEPKRRSKNKKKPQFSITGTSQYNADAGNNFKSTYVKKAWYYVGKVSQETDIDAVKSYICDKLSSEDVTVEKLPVKGSYQSFRVGVLFAFKDVLFKEEFWPQGVTVRRFNFASKSFLVKTTA